MAAAFAVVASNTLAVVAPLSIGRSLPHGGRVHGHLRSVVQTAVGLLVYELKSDSGGVILREPIAGVEACDAGALENQIGLVVLEHRIAELSLDVGGSKFKGSLSEALDVSVLVVVHSFDATDGLDAVAVAPSAHCNSLDASLLRHEFTKNGTRRRAIAVREQDNVLRLEPRLTGDVGKLAISGYVDTAGYIADENVGEIPTRDCCVVIY